MYIIMNFLNCIFGKVPNRRGVQDHDNICLVALCDQRDTNHGDGDTAPVVPSTEMVSLAPQIWSHWYPIWRLEHHGRDVWHTTPDSVSQFG